MRWGAAISDILFFTDENAFGLVFTALSHGLSGK